jgi:hypothetical protein
MKNLSSQQRHDYIEGAKARANKQDFRPLATKAWQEGFESMHELVASVEQDIVLLVFKYQTVATNRIEELLEEHTRATAVASSATGSTGSGQ